MVENYNFSTLSLFQQPFTVNIETMKAKLIQVFYTLAFVVLNHLEELGKKRLFNLSLRGSKLAYNERSSLEDVYDICQLLR